MELSTIHNHQHTYPQPLDTPHRGTPPDLGGHQLGELVAKEIVAAR